MRAESLETKGGNWRAAIRKLTDKKLTELLAERETCATRLYNGRRYRLASLSAYDLRVLAREMATDSVKRAIHKAA